MTELPLTANLALFVFGAAAVWVAGAHLTECVDLIAERKNLGRGFMGFLVLATATQLPEVVTNSTAALDNNPRLVLNSMFGGVSMQTAVLVLADLRARRYSLTFLAEGALNPLQAAMLLLILTLLSAAALVGDRALLPAVGAVPFALMLAYAVVLRVSWQHEKNSAWRPTEVAEQDSEDEQYEPSRSGLTRRVHAGGMGRAYAHSLVAAAVILIVGVGLVRTAEAVATQSGLGQSFIGVTLLASATSLPEVSTTLTAVRLRQYSMAVADIFGSNMIMVALLLPSDILYRQGVLLADVGASAQFALALGGLLTAVYLVGLLARPKRRYRGLGLDSWAVTILYPLGVYFLYTLR